MSFTVFFIYIIIAYVPDIFIYFKNLIYQRLALLRCEQNRITYLHIIYNSANYFEWIPNAWEFI